MTEFFALTKRMHHKLHGSPGGRAALGCRRRAPLRAGHAANCEQPVRQRRAGDIVVLHDPQTAGMAEHLHGDGGSGGVAVPRRHR